MAESKTAVPGFLPELKYRPCCLFADKLEFIHDIPVFGHIWPKIMVDISSDADLRHRAGTSVFGMILRRERSGTVYTCAGGFIDLGHLRDFADLTRHYYFALVRQRVNGVVQRGANFALLETHGGISGEVVVQRDLPAAGPGDLDLLVAVARSIAYDVSVMYEIKTYGEERIGGRSSSFSPEDLVSNYLGTYVGGRALKLQIANSRTLPTEEADERTLATTFDAAATVELKTLLQKLRIISVAETIAAFKKTDGHWVSSEGLWPPNFADVNYVRQRNFEIRPVEPWLVPGTCDDTTFPADIDRELPNDAVTAHLTRYFYESSFFQDGNLNTDFDRYVAQIKTDARQRYGQNFDKPTL